MMATRLISTIAAGLFSFQASALSINVDFSPSFFGRPDAEFISPAGPHTAGYWNSLTSGIRQLRDKTVAISGVLANLTALPGGSSQFSGGDFSNPNVVLADAFGLRSGFRYKLSNLPNGLYDLFLYARSPSETFTDGGVPIIPISIDNLVGDIFTYAYSVDISGGVFDLGKQGGVAAWVSGLQITNDQAPQQLSDSVSDKLPVPATAWIFLIGIFGLLSVRRLRHLRHKMLHP